MKARLGSIIEKLANMKMLYTGNAHYSLLESSYIGSFYSVHPKHYLVSNFLYSFVGFYPVKKDWMTDALHSVHAALGLEQIDLGELIPVLSRLSQTELMAFGGCPFEEIEPYPDLELNCWEPEEAIDNFKKRYEELFYAPFELDATLEW